MNKSKKAWWIVLTLALLIKLFSLFPVTVERYYSTGFYPVISRFQRLLFGWIPWSMGDIFYAIAGMILFARLTRFIKTLAQKKTGKETWWNGLKWCLFWGLWVYVLFNILWGLNYNRLGPAYQLQLHLKPYSTEELEKVMAVLLRKIDSTAPGSAANRNLYLKKQRLFNESYRSYEKAENSFPQFVYRYKSIKPSLYSYLGDYLGYTGYYNPFTGEAQVNTTVPVFVQPFTTCHEMGHQLGYARENEANFAGYLAAKSSGDPAFRYSVYFDLYSYGIRELYRRDSLAAKQLNERAPAQLKKDYHELTVFYDRFQNPVEPYMTGLYARYLKANQQPSGMRSYSEVMAFLVANYNKYGADSL
jgi:hypothetical protein